MSGNEVESQGVVRSLTGGAPVIGVPWYRTPVWTGALAIFAIGALLSPPADAVADSNLTVHMFQHIGLFAFAIFFGYALEKDLTSHLADLRRLTYAGWKVFTSVMVANSRTKGVVFVVLIPAVVFAYWHLPQNFDLAVQNEPVHVLEHFTYIVSGSMVGLSYRVLKPKWRVTLLYVAFMHAGMMGSIWSVWKPPFFSLYSYAANLQMDTSLLLFGAIGVVGTSSWMLKVLDII